MFSCNSFTLGRGRSGNMACTLDFPLVLSGEATGRDRRRMGLPGGSCSRSSVLCTELGEIRSTGCSETSCHLLSITKSPGPWGHGAQGPLPGTAASSLHSAPPSREGNELGQGLC